MKIKELLNSPEKWTKHCYARDALSIPVSACSEDAYSFCLLGAVTHCYEDPCQHSDITEKIATTLDCDNAFGIIDFNDAKETTFANITALINKLDI